MGFGKQRASYLGSICDGNIATIFRERFEIRKDYP
jgi:hypothetical protein